MEPNYTTESPIRYSTAQTGHANGADWQEEIYQKIKTMKDLYLPEISEMYQKIAAKLQQHDSLPQQSNSDQLEKLKVFKTMLERIITFLQVSKNNISLGYKEKFGSYEKQILNFINVNRPKMPALQQGQLPVPHMQSVLSHENKEWDQYKEIAIDYTILPTPGGDGAVAASSVVDPSAGDGSSIVDLATPDAPLS
ncbi:hypothetical protein CMV_026336 [Castanea mollissima]|uniref:Mediator of RNA polymerase II transcription subunit 15a n=1 Tax=Castanea mollissima TaxID=60419 RepID=A0A8J4QM65_9ROSI|nr:hypothetical protein CMV_026336 [Castanea mollissima]